MSIIDEVEDTETEGGTEVPRPSDVSILDHLRARREQIGREKTRQLDLPIPGYEEKLGVRYRYPWANANRVIATAQRLATSLMTAEVAPSFEERVDLLVKCCHELVCRDSVNEDWRPLDPHHDPDVPLRFSDRLADMLNIPLPERPEGKQRSNAPFIARHVFSPGAEVTGIYEGDPALASQALAVAGWLQRVDVAADEDLLGE